ncbi:MAG: hypothetical protein KDI43_04170 [Gammaproteobacteria bacterium]|nr:hypothetical protein [Gammaproteobacteria bacterium]
MKQFDERRDARVRGRIDSIKPGYYTRMGAALLHASNLLREQPAGRRLLLTDGKPNDLDKYEAVTASKIRTMRSTKCATSACSRSALPWTEKTADICRICSVAAAS